MSLKKIHPGELFFNLIAGIAIVIISATISPSVNAATDDACSLLTAAQVSAAAAVSVGAGTYATPTFKKTCTWTPSGDDAKAIQTVTLLLQSPEAFETGKKFGGAKSAVVTPVSGVGDDAYYLVIGATVSMVVKKGNAAFKVSVYASGVPLEKKQAIEKVLALQVASRL
jgi:hypothetical protein